MKTRVNVGDCYRDSAVPWSEWRVERIYRDSIGLPHAVVSSLQDRTVSRTIACPTLVDRRRFWPIAARSERRTVDATRPVGCIALAQPVDVAAEAAA